MPKGVTKSSVYPMRFEADELALLKVQSKEFNLRSVAALIRIYIRICQGTPTRLQEEAADLDDIRLQLRGVATNLNQMAKAANAGKFRLTSHVEAELKDLQETVRVTLDLLNAYKDATRIRSLVRALAYFEAKEKTLEESKAWLRSLK